MPYFSNKKILLFAPRFFGYEKEIVSKLTELGAEVVYYDERPENTVFVKASIRINKKLIQQKIDNYYTQILAATAGTRFDYVFVVNLEAITPAIIAQLRQQQAGATFLLYMWDSIRNKKPALDALPCFDLSYSFDRDDADKISGVKFRPLFYVDAYDADKWKNEPVKEDTDLCFLGTIHSDRYALLQRIKSIAEAKGLTMYYYLYFHKPILFWYKKMRDAAFYKASYRQFHFTPLTKEQIMHHIRRSKAIIDIQHPNQTGLTMRSIEMIGARKKFITTNDAIEKYDFFNASNVCVIDRSNPVIPLEFLQLPYQELPAAIRFKYSIEGWLREIFEGVTELPSKPVPGELKVSIITVVLDNNRFIRDAIESVLSQDYPAIEYIVVDGGSKDGSLEVIKSYGSRITHVISEPDQGIYDAMNKGLKMATGDVVGFLNSDDFYTSDHVISDVVVRMGFGTDAVYGNVDYVGLKNKSKIIRKWRSGLFSESRFYRGWMPPHPTFFARREVYEKFGGYNTSLQSSADYELMLRLLLRHRIRVAYLEKVLVKMRVGGQSNRSLLNRIKANLEDRKAWIVNGLTPRFYTLWLKPLQKILQYRF